MNLGQFLLLTEAVMRVFENRMEYTEDCFVELNDQEYASWRRQQMPEKGRIFRVVPHEPTVNADNRLELTVCDELEMYALIDATQLVYHYCEGAAQEFESFEDRLRYAGRMMPEPLVPPDLRS